MDELINSAVARWGLSGEVCLVAERENLTYRIDCPDKRRFALRRHRPGYNDKRELCSELDWLSHLHAEGLMVPSPIRSRGGIFVEELGGCCFSVLEWLPGKPIGVTGRQLELKSAPGVFNMLGRTMAQLHLISDRWSPPQGFKRRHWDAKGLLGEHPVWGRFWENPHLTEKQAEVFSRVRQKAMADLDLISTSLDYGLIHADCVRENVLLNGGDVFLIDFDDSGYGYRLFDIATALLKNRNEPNYGEIEAALLEGYLQERFIDTSALPLFMLLRALTYVGWIIDRMEETDGATRSRRLIADAEFYLNEYSG